MQENQKGMAITHGEMIVTTVSWDIGKWLESGYFLKVKSVGFPNRLDMGCKREESRRTLRSFT